MKDSAREAIRALTQGNVASLFLRGSYLGLALRGEVLLDEQGPQRHAEVLVGLSEAEAAQLQLLLHAVDLPGELVDGAAEGGGQVLAQRRHDAPQHVVVQNPGDRREEGGGGQSSRSVQSTDGIIINNHLGKRRSLHSSMCFTLCLQHKCWVSASC